MKITKGIVIAERRGLPDDTTVLILGQSPLLIIEGRTVTKFLSILYCP